MTPTEQTETICRVLIPLIAEKQEQLHNETGQHYLLTVDVPALALLSILPVFVAAIENLTEDLVPDAYHSAMQLNEELLTHIIDGYGETSPEDHFNVVAALREAGVNVTAITTADGETTTIPPIDGEKGT